MSVNNDGASFVQLAEPNTFTRDATGMCLRFAQSVFGAPVAHRSATDAANATKFRHHTKQMPDVAALVWFDHYGTYQNEYANWGHVVAWVPGNGFLSSPGAGFGQQWFPSIDAVERTFNATFRFWSEDINTLRVAEPINAAKTSGGYPMFDVYWTGPHTGKTNVSGRLVTNYGSFWVYSPQIMNLLERRKNAALKPGTSDNMLDAEHEIINSFLRACFQSVLSGVQFDQVKLNTALNDAFKAMGKNIVVDGTTDIDPDLLAAAFEQATPRIVAAMLKQAGQQLAS